MLKGKPEMTIEITETRRILADGLRFTECPRWHDGSLYFSDMHDNKVYRLAQDGVPEAVARLDCNAGGLGFAPGGDLLVAAMGEGRVLRLREGKLDQHADLSGMVRNGINDMIVSPEGRCYVGRYFHPDPPYDEPLFFIDEFGGIHETADRLDVANGIALTADGKSLIVAESAGCRLASFEIAPDGMPVNKRTFAQLPEGFYPDGICGDSAGGIWVACTTGPGVIRVEEGGRITHRVTIGDGRFAYACALGGAAGDTLFICTGGAFDPVSHRTDGAGRIESVQVPVHQAGIP